VTENTALLSIIIPAFNEEECIGDTLDAISGCGLTLPFDVIVVDNGSTDRTAAIVTEKGFTSIYHPDATVASVRNKGVQHSRGNILVFIDADVSVTQTWAREMTAVAHHLLEKPFTVTGSRCLHPNNEVFLAKHWYRLLLHYKSNYINSGHLITTKRLFNAVSGFSEHLETAEDYDFCLKAQSKGAEIVSNTDLPVIHHGYPSALKSFIRRERWHGKQDFSTFKDTLNSKVALTAIFHLLLLIFCIFGSIAHQNFLFLVLYAVIMLILSLALTLYKYDNNQVHSLVKTAFIFYCYIIGRTLSLLDRIFRKGVI